MDSVRLITNLIILIVKITSAYRLSVEPSSQTADVTLSFTCTTNQEFVAFNKNNGLYCLIQRLNNDICKLNPDCDTAKIYSCNITTNIVKISIPKSSVTDNLHGSKWTCANPFGIGNSSNEIELYIKIPITKVTLSTTPSDGNPIEIVTGVKKRFECKTDAGRPSSAIQWYISGTNVTDVAVSQPDICYSDCKGKVVSSSVLLYKGNRIDEGKHIYCTALNIESQSVRSQNKSIVILYGPSTIELKPATYMYEVTEAIGNVGPIMCTADCNPTCTMAWSRPNLSDINLANLYLEKIDRSQAGNYECTATNTIASKSSIITVVVNYSPRIVSLSPDDKLYTVIEALDSVNPITCSAYCKPECNITWSGPNLPEDSTSVLRLSNINRNQKGDYHCTAKNTIGNKISETIIIDVNYGPAVVTISPSTPTYTVEEFSDTVIKITCQVDDCNPNCTMTWDGPHIPTHSDGVLNLQRVRREQAGNYTCTASNNAWSRKSVTVNIKVEYGPIIVNIIPSIQNYTVKETIESVNPITCTADCNPVCVFAWIGPTITYNLSVLNLSYINRSQAGNYKCTATNSVGSNTSFTVIVTVHYGPNQLVISPNTEHYTVNETGNVMPISCSSECKPSCIVTWSGPNLPTVITPDLNLQNINRQQTGNYQCTASNYVKFKTSHNITIIVNYRPTVNRLIGNRTYYENDTVSFSCEVDSVPDSNITWIFENRNIDQRDLVSVSLSSQVSHLNIRRIGCLSMGMYNCTAGNIVGEDTTGMDIDIMCSPRINDLEYNVSTVITVRDQEPLNITAPVIAYPVPKIYWTLWNNESSVNVTQKTSTRATKNRAYSNLYIDNVTESDFGSYRVYAFNNVGKLDHYIHVFNVIPERKPNPPNNVTCFARPNSVLIHWKSSFNGGDTQIFLINIQKNGELHFYDYDQAYVDPGQNKYSKATIEQLAQGTMYKFRVKALNKHNFTLSETVSCNTTLTVGDDQSNTNIVAIGAGTGFGAASIILVIMLTFVFIRRRKNDECLGNDKEPFQRSKATEDENEEDGLKENPLYVTSTQEHVGAVYSVVEKHRHNIKKDTEKLTEDSNVYSQAVKPNKKDLKSKEIEMGCVYQISAEITLSQTDDIYANSEVNSNIKDKHVITPNKNKDGLIYADLDLATTSSERRFVIRGLENRNNYAIIDLSKTAEPLPSDSDNEEDQTTTER